MSTISVLRPVRRLSVIILVLIALVIITISNTQVAQAGGSAVGIAIRPVRVCLNGVTFVGRSIDIAATNRLMLSHIYLSGGPLTPIANGNSQTFTALWQFRGFTIHYPVGTFSVGQPVIYGVYAADNSGYGRYLTANVQKCKI